MKAPATRSRGRLATAAGTAIAVAALSGIFIPSAQAAETQISDVTMRWGMNQEAGGGAYFGGCNFLSAGAAGDAGSSRVWTESDGFYSNAAGNVRIEKDGVDGTKVTPTWSTKCVDGAGRNVTPAAGSSTNNQVVLSAGQGTVDAGAGTANVQWDGDFTVVFYGGMTYWTASDPALSVEADGSATLTATASGYGSSMEDPTKWVSLAPQTVELATFTDAALTTDGFTGTPDYRGVVLTGVDNQVTSGPNAGAFPQSFIDFQHQTGQASYWYSSGGAADLKKVATGLSAAWIAPTTPADPGPTGDSQELEIGVEVPTAATPTTPEEFKWTIGGSGAVSLGSAQENAAGSFAATGALPAITVTDTRAEQPGWSLSGSVSEFSSGSGSFAANALGWTPTVANNTVGASAGQSVAPAAPGLARSAVLASASAGHASGSADISAGLSLLAPAGTPAGSYTSTLTITALSD
ncbi:hypothetical protein ACX80Z_01925 [Arthrobacter sp. TMT4-20]